MGGGLVSEQKRDETFLLELTGRGAEKKKKTVGVKKGKASTKNRPQRERKLKDSQQQKRGRGRDGRGIKKKREKKKQSPLTKSRAEGGQNFSRESGGNKKNYRLESGGTGDPKVQLQKRENVRRDDLSSSVNQRIFWRRKSRWRKGHERVLMCKEEKTGRDNIPDYLPEIGAKSSKTPESLGKKLRRKALRNKTLKTQEGPALQSRGREMEEGMESHEREGIGLERRGKA